MNFYLIKLFKKIKIKSINIHFCFVFFFIFKLKHTCNNSVLNVGENLYLSCILTIF